MTAQAYCWSTLYCAVALSIGDSARTPPRSTIIYTDSYHRADFYPCRVIFTL